MNFRINFVNETTFCHFPDTFGLAVMSSLLSIVIVYKNSFFLHFLGGISIQDVAKIGL